MGSYHTRTPYHNLCGFVKRAEEQANGNMNLSHQKSSSSSGVTSQARGENHQIRAKLEGRRKQQCSHPKQRPESQYAQ